MEKLNALYEKVCKESFKVGDIVKVTLNNGDDIIGKLEKENPIKIRIDATSTRIIPNGLIKYIKKESLCKEDLSPNDLKRALEVYIVTGSPGSGGQILNYMKDNLDLKLGRDFEYVTNQKIDGKYVSVLFLMTPKALGRWVPGTALKGFSRTSVKDLEKKGYELWTKESLCKESFIEVPDMYEKNIKLLGIKYSKTPNDTLIMSGQDIIKKALKNAKIPFFEESVYKEDYTDVADVLTRDSEITDWHDVEKLNTYELDMLLKNPKKFDLKAHEIKNIQIALKKSKESLCKEALTKDEIDELAVLISIHEISGVIGVKDFRRRKNFEDRASENDLRKACKIAGVKYNDIYNESAAFTKDKIVAISGNKVTIKSYDNKKYTVEKEYKKESVCKEKWSVYSVYDDYMDAKNTVDDFNEVGQKAKIVKVSSGFAVYIQESLKEQYYRVSNKDFEQNFSMKKPRGYIKKSIVPNLNVKDGDILTDSNRKDYWIVKEAFTGDKMKKLDSLYENVVLKEDYNFVLTKQDFDSISREIKSMFPKWDGRGKKYEWVVNVDYHQNYGLEKNKGYVSCEAYKFYPETRILGKIYRKGFFVNKYETKNKLFADIKKYFSLVARML